MKIKIYIVTYKKNDVLNENLKSLWENTDNFEDIDVTILANHPEIIINEENKRNNLNIVINTTRMPHAWGYLSRDWNFGILDAFKTWENPNNITWCVLAQNDVTWIKGWDTWLRDNKKYDFISQPRGDLSMAINIEAVKQIGFFDERLTTICWQEMDYLRRAKLILKNRASINDDHIKNSFNDGLSNVITRTTTSGEIENLHISKWHSYGYNFVMEKWKVSLIKREILKKNLLIDKTLITSRLPREIDWYPFFWDGYEKKNKLNLLRIYEYKKSKIIIFINLLRKFISAFIPSKKLRRKIRGQNND